MRSVVRTILNPIQSSLLKRNLCPGCTKSLDNANKIKDVGENHTIVQCSCKRLFVRDNQTKTYRRVTLEEEKIFLTK